MGSARTGRCLSLRMVMAMALACLSGCDASNGPVPVTTLSSVAGVGAIPSVPAVDVGPTSASITWHACANKALQAPGFTTDCGTSQVPLRWSRPLDRSIDLHVVRMRRQGSGGSAGQLWMLQGGPGYSGESLFQDARFLGDNVPGVDLYLLDHRGTGRSTRLGCPVQEADASDGGWIVTLAEWPACLAAVRTTWGNDLTAFSTTEAAIDLGKLIDATRKPGQPVYVQGVSYGTYWGHRYLQVWPDQADAVVLDSVCAPGSCVFNDYAKDFDDVGHALLDRCGKDASCATKLGPDPWNRLIALDKKLAAGHCKKVVKAGLDPSALRRLLAALLAGDDDRLLIAPLLYRLDRCNAQDAELLEDLAHAVVQDQPVTPTEGALMREVYSSVLYTHIALSELWNPQATAAQLTAQQAGLAIAPAPAQDLAALRSIWPLGVTDPLASQWARSNVPLLLLNGDLDPQTPLRFAQTALAHITDAHQHLLVMPNAVHGVVSRLTARGQCGAAILGAWLADPSAQPTGTCIQTLKPLDFAGGGKLAGYFFQNTDVWDSQGKSKGHDLRAVPLQTLQALRDRQHLPPQLWSR
jgi:pimeloyl-ACP methyl ester carboxylesterase